MIIFLYGTDTYRSRRKLSEVVANFREREDKAGLNTAVLDAAKTDIGELQQALFAPAFLGNKRLVVVDGLLARKREEQKPFADLVAKLPDSTVAVFYEKADAKTLEKSPLFALLTAGKFHWEFAPLDARAMAGWLGAEAAKRGVAFAPAALGALAEAVGSDSARGASELDKLAAYVGDRKEVAAEDVALLTAGEAQEDMFGFLDAVAARERERAIRLLEEQVAAGTEPMQLLAMLARTVRLLLGAKDLLERGVPPNEAIKELGIHPFAGRKALGQAQSFGADALRNLHAALLDADRKIKTGGVPHPRVALDLIVARILLAG